MLPRTARAGILIIIGATLVGCGGGGKKTDVSASTVAPATSGAGGVAVPGGTGTAPQNPPIAPSPSPTPTVPVTPSVGLGNAYVTSFLLNEMQVVDMSTMTVSTHVPTGKGPTGVAVNGTYAYVANGLDQNVAVVDRLTNTVINKIDVSSTPITGISMIDSMIQPLVRPAGIAVTPNGQKAFTANLVNVTSIDLVGMKPLKSIFSLNLNFSGGLSGIGTTITNFLSMPLAAAGPAKVAATNTRVFATNVITNNVSMISATDDKVMSNTAVGKLPYGVAVANGKAYVACAMTNEIWILDGTTGAVLKSFKGGLMPFDVTASPKGDKVYVANLAGGAVTVIDTAADIPVGVLPAGMSIASIFRSLGVPIPSGGASGMSGALSAFLAAFMGGGTSGGAGSGSGTIGSLLAALMGGSSSSTSGAGGLLSPNAIMSALMSAMMSFMGINSSSLGGLNMPALGIASVSVSAGGDKVVCANWFMGQVTVTDVSTLQVTGLMPGTSGMGPADVATGR